jgi:hypothetical protein
MQTKSGAPPKPHPFDAHPRTGWVLEPDSDVVVSRKYFVSHFATCPNAGLHRAPKVGVE